MRDAWNAHLDAWMDEISDLIFVQLRALGRVGPRDLGLKRYDLRRRRPGETVRQAMLRTVTFDRNPTGPHYRRDEDVEAAHEARQAAAARPRPGARVGERIAPWTDLGKEHRLRSGRCFAVTQGGMFGPMAPEVRAGASGDVVAVLLGCFVPVLLRPRAQGDGYSFVGEA